MGAILKVIDDDFRKEKDFGYINDDALFSIVRISNEKSFSCLSYVLGYENTIFNSAQIEEIESELTQLNLLFKDKKILEILDKIGKAIAYAKKDPPSYLFFEGD